VSEAKKDPVVFVIVLFLMCVDGPLRATSGFQPEREVTRMKITSCPGMRTRVT
jgi:hypothetical protein